jgi:hypothetical protein
MKSFRIIPFVAVLGLAACAAPIAQIDEGRGAFDSVHVLSIQHAEVGHSVFNNPVRYMGLTGAIVAGSTDRSRARALQERMGEFDVPGVFQHHLEAAFEQRGVSVSWAEPRVDMPPVRANDPVPREYERDNFTLRRHYAATDAGDIQLDIGVQFAGYAADGVGDSNPYRPTVMVNVRVVSADGDRVMYQNAVHYNPVNAGEGTVTIPADADVAYPSFDDLRSADAEELHRALQEALRAVAYRIVADL